MNSTQNHSHNCSTFIRFLLVALLPTLFLAFIYLNYFHIISIGNISREILYITSFIYFVFLLFIPHNAYIAECKIKARFTQLSNALDNEIEQTSVVINNRRKSVLNIREFLQSYFSNIRNDNFAKIATSTFPMLGILGTFIAIAISMPDFTVSDTKELDKEISSLLSGVGTAFYASIFGIFLSLLWSFFERYGLSKIEKLSSSIENIYQHSIWSKQELLKFQYEQKQLLENEFTSALKEVFNLDFIKDINKEHLKSYEEIINITQNGLEHIRTSLLEASNTLSKNVKQLHSTNEAIEAQRNIQNNLAVFNKSNKELKELLLSFDNSLDTALIKIDRELAKSVDQISKMAKIVKELE